MNALTPTCLSTTTVFPFYQASLKNKHFVPSGNLEQENVYDEQSNARHKYIAARILVIHACVYGSCPYTYYEYNYCKHTIFCKIHILDIEFQACAQNRDQPIYADWRARLCA